MIFFALALAGAVVAEPEVARTVVIVAHNKSATPNLPSLRFADDDGLLWRDALRPHARRTMTAIALDDDTQASRPLMGPATFPPTAAGLRAAVAAATAGVRSDRAAGLRTELVFVFVGHGSLDEEGKGALHLADGLLRRAQLFADVIDAVGADISHVILDACHAYSVMAGRGNDAESALMLRALSTFLAGNELDAHPSVGVLVATTDSGETHEWSRIRQGLFSHQLRSALSGAADVNGDGRLEYSEVAAFVDAANTRLPRGISRLSVFAWPPPADRAAPLLDLRPTPRRAGDELRWLVLGARLSGRITVEREDGTALVTLHKDSTTQTLLSVPAGRALFVRAGARERRLPAASTTIHLDALDDPSTRLASRGAVDHAFEDALFSVPFGEPYYRGFLSGRSELVPVDDAAVRLEIDSAANPRIDLRVDIAYQLSPFLLADALSSPPLEHGLSARVLWTGLPVGIGVLVEGAATPLGRARADVANRAALLGVADARLAFLFVEPYVTAGLGLGLFQIAAGDSSSVDPTVLVGRAAVGVDVPLTTSMGRFATGASLGVHASLLTVDGQEELRAAPFVSVGVALSL